MKARIREKREKEHVANRACLGEATIHSDEQRHAAHGTQGEPDADDNSRNSKNGFHGAQARPRNEPRSAHSGAVIRKHAAGDDAFLVVMRVIRSARPNGATLFKNLPLKVGDGGERHDTAKHVGLRVFQNHLCLEILDDDAPVRLDTTQGVARFTDARSGSLLAELKIGDEDQQDA